jgi:hypothetical protein
MSPNRVNENYAKTAPDELPEGGNRRMWLIFEAAMAFAPRSTALPVSPDFDVIGRRVSA